MDKINAWQYFRSFFSTNHTQNYLKKCYQNLSDGEKLSFQNSYTFIYYLEHGKKYYDQALTAPYELQPVLLFYGMIQLLKATILTIDPNYPATTQVLAHGVSTRKRKKSSYEFLDDEVKIQKNGLLTYFAESLFNMKGLDGEKYKMGNLMKRIPELQPLFLSNTNEKVSYPIKLTTNNTFSVKSEILDHLHLTADRFVSFLNDHLKIKEELLFAKNRHSKIKIESCYEEANQKQLLIKYQGNLNNLSSSLFQLNHCNQQFYVPANRELYCFFPEIIAHYLVLYNLSMVCRYETEWWGELFHSYPSNDYPFITEFLEITRDKVPYYIALFLDQRK